jgi:hypothetical protein
MAMQTPVHNSAERKNSLGLGKKEANMKTSSRVRRLGGIGYAETGIDVISAVALAAALALTLPWMGRVGARSATGWGGRRHAALVETLDRARLRPLRIGCHPTPKAGRAVLRPSPSRGG